jgi:steroid delta-isomerase-like uncharacterized protein
MPDDPKAVVRRCYHVVTSGDFEGLAAVMADDVVEHEQLPGLEPNKEGVIQFFRGMRDAFPDMEMVPDAIIAEGDTVAARVTLRGTHRGDFMGIPATGNAVEVAVADFFRIEDGRIAEHWGVADMASMMEQLGVAST